MSRAEFSGEPLVTRRRFVRGLTAASVLTGVGAWVPLRASAGNTELRGTEFDLSIGEAAVNVTGRARVGTLVNGSLPGPTLRWREGDTVTLRVHNELTTETALHWHGLVLPADMDGVPGVSFHGIAAGETFTYRFPVRQSGTYWYHAHAGFQEQAGVYGAIVIEPLAPAPFAYDREHVVLLSDWTDRDPLELYRLLKRQPGYFNYNDRTLGDFVRDSRRDGLRRTLEERAMWGRMRMKPSDLADVGGHGYTYLINGAAPAANWTGVFTPGERARLRFINGSAMSIFDVRIPGLTMTVVAADGQYVRPVDVDEFRLSAAETIDVIVEPSSAEAYTIFAQSMDRAGYARGTLAVREGASAAVPELDEVQYLQMSDMGHGAAHGGTPEAHDHSAGSASAARDAESPRGTTEHAGHTRPTPAQSEHSSHGAAHARESPAGSALNHEGHGGSPVGAAVQGHPASEAGNPGVDMQAATPASRLADPGVGLRDNGRRVLTYADLRSAFDDPDGREPERTIELHLTGHMERFVWSFDGIPFSGSDPIELCYGERVRITLVNDTMMEHPIHLHGMWSDLEDESGEFLVRKHTISMPPGTRRSFRVTADAPGRWAFHCHFLFHMEAGMFREVRVSEPGEAGTVEQGPGVMSTPKPRHLVATAGKALLALLLAGRVLAQPVETPAGLPVHEMLEDPFNRSVVFDELELHGGGDLDWDANAWFGYAFNRLSVRTEGERVDNDTERAELQLLWTHSFARWWDIVAGARADFEPGSSREWAAFGVQGLAPYRFELQATAFVGENGDTAARFEGEYELLITNRLILQPQLELNWHGQSDLERRIGAGLSSVEAGLRLRYEFRREVAPYVGLVRERLLGGTADFARADGFDSGDTSLVAGIRLRF